jgi:hypothetical protein
MSGRKEFLVIVSLTLERVEEVADLHQRILPTSPIPCLGKRFMTRFYYPRLLADSHSFCELYEVEGKAVAFISYTCDSQSLFRNWIRRHSLSLAWHLGVTLCSAPQTLKTMIQALQLVRQHREETTEKIPAEILSFGVLPEYRSLEFFQRTRKKIANELFAVAKKKLGSARSDSF